MQPTPMARRSSTDWLRMTSATVRTPPYAPRSRRDAGVGVRSAKDVVEEMLRRQQAGDSAVLDDLVAADMVNHAAGPQGREGLRLILRTIDEDLGPVTSEQHHLIGEGDLVA